MCLDRYEYARGPSRNVVTSNTLQTVDTINYDIVQETVTIIPETTALIEPDPIQEMVEEEWNPEVTISTTTIFTPGVDTTAQAMEIKAVADNLLGATGSVLGMTAAILSGSPRLIVGGVVYGDMVGRWVGAGMWNLIN
jgi:hypothetical protein